VESSLVDQDSVYMWKDKFTSRSIFQ
jgi:hypothetical protein